MALNRMLKDMKRGLLVSPRHEQYLQRSQGDVVLSEAALRFVLSELSSGDRDRRYTFSASGRGACLRQQMLGYLGTKGSKTFTSDQAATFIHGTWTHLKWQAMGLDAGWLSEVEVPCRWDEYGLTGTIDGLLDTGEGWELKSINSRGFRRVCEEGPEEKHIFQVHSYMMATGIRAWSIMYECKDDQGWREWVVPYDEDVAGELITELEALKHSRESRELPPILDGCMKREGNHYRNCPFKDTCLETTTWPLTTSKGIKIARRSA